VINRGRIVQNAYIVENLEAACERMNRLYGIGPFVGGVAFELNHHVYRGRPSPPIPLKTVFVQSGDLNIELIQLLSDAPSAFRDMYQGKSEGLHHVAMFCDNYEVERDALVAAGMPVASELLTVFGAKICYIDARETMGHMIELYPENKIIRRMYQQVKDAAIAWDKKHLIVPWA
jgi:hypothetical protein